MAGGATRRDRCVFVNNGREEARRALVAGIAGQAGRDVGRCRELLGNCEAAAVAGCASRCGHHSVIHFCGGEDAGCRVARRASGVIRWNVASWQRAARSTLECRRRGMAGLARSRRRDVRCGLALRGRAVVAARAVGDTSRMDKCRAKERCCRLMACLAGGRCRDVRCRLAFCGRAVVAGRAVGDASRVNKRRSEERNCCLMARVTCRSRRYVR